MCEVHKPEKTEEMLQEFFFEAMQNGYVVSPPKVPIVGLPGSKSIRYERGGLLFVDFWFASPHSESSYGMTVISFEGRPIWVMHYGGFYQKEAIPFLKVALRAAYAEGHFIGGRGPLHFTEPGSRFVYYNNIATHLVNSFTGFQGFETVLDESGFIAGTHHYFGGTML